MPRTRITVLMTVHNRKDTTLECLRRLFAQEGIGNTFDINVFLTDDGSTDGTATAVAKEFPSVKIIQGDGTLFWNRGMYKAWKEAARQETDFFLWLNDDTFLFTDCLEKLLDASSKYCDKAIIVGSTCDSKSRQLTTYGGWDGNGKIIPCPSCCTECTYMNGNIVLIPFSVFRILGYNDPYYRHSLGDTDYSMVAGKNGIKLILSPGFSGICDLHPREPLWKDPHCPFSARWKDMMKPTGANPVEYFHYRKKNFGFIPAFMTFISNICHVCFPRLWK